MAKKSSKGSMKAVAASQDGPKIDIGHDPMKGKDGGHDDYEADQAMNDLMRAKEHEENEDLMKRVAKKVGRKHKSIQSLRDTYAKKFGRESEEMDS